MKLPYKINWLYESVAIIIIVAALAGSVYFYQNFPALVPTHWNLAGQADIYSSKAFAAFFFPLLITALYLLLLFLPLTDPLRQRYQQFSKVYQIIRLSLIVFLTALYFITALIGLGYNISVNKVVPVGVGLLFIVLGNFMPKIKKNWFVGIKTPWTLSNEEIWNKTHRLGGKIFILAGLLFILMLFLPNWLFIYMFTIIVIMVLGGTIGYSWWLWKKQKTN